MKKIIAVCSLFVFFALPAMAELKDVAVLMLLDKVTAQSKAVYVDVGRTIAFESLNIKVERCDKKPSEDMPESAVFLNITEIKNDKMISIFEGWMFASNPSIHSLEHAVYDVWIIDCK